MIYVLYMAFIFYLFKILYGYEVIESYLESIDVAFFMTIILTTFSIIYGKNKYFENYNKAMWENDFQTEKFKDIYR